jgi:flavodoxin
MNSHNIESLSIIYFSPTNTTKNIISSIANGMGIEQVQFINLTLPKNRKNQVEIAGDLIIIGIPVYNGKIPALLDEWLHQIQGRHRPVILISVYGNVKSGIILQQFQSICKRVDLIPVGVASFATEHSFSTDKFKIAVNKLDEHDLKSAYQFGARMIEKLNSLNSLENGRIRLPEQKRRYVT